MGVKCILIIPHVYDYELIWRVCVYVCVVTYLVTVWSRILPSAGLVGTFEDVKVVWNDEYDRKYVGKVLHDKQWLGDGRISVVHVQVVNVLTVPEENRHRLLEMKALGGVRWRNLEKIDTSLKTIN